MISVLDLLTLTRVVLLTASLLLTRLIADKGNNQKSD